MIETWLSRPSAESHRIRSRRDLAFLHTAAFANRALTEEAAAEFARRVSAWIEDPDDVSGPGFVGVLADLGPAGEREIARGLSGPARSRYVGGLAGGADRYLGLEVIAALLSPVDRRTPQAERREILGIAFRIAPGATVPLLDALRARLADADRGDVDSILGIVRHRIPAGS